MQKAKIEMPTEALSGIEYAVQELRDAQSPLRLDNVTALLYEQQLTLLETWLNKAASKTGKKVGIDRSQAIALIWLLERWACADPFTAACITDARPVLDNLVLRRG